MKYKKIITLLISICMITSCKESSYYNISDYYTTEYKHINIEDSNFDYEYSSLDFLHPDFDFYFRGFNGNSLIFQKESHNSWEMTSLQLFEYNITTKEIYIIDEVDLSKFKCENYKIDLIKDNIMLITKFEGQNVKHYYYDFEKRNLIHYFTLATDDNGNTYKPKYNRPVMLGDKIYFDDFFLDESESVCSTLYEYNITSAVISIIDNQNSEYLLIFNNELIFYKNKQYINMDNKFIFEMDNKNYENQISELLSFDDSIIYSYYIFDDEYATGTGIGLYTKNFEFNNIIKSKQEAQYLSNPQISKSFIAWSNNYIEPIIFFDLRSKNIISIDDFTYYESFIYDDNLCIITIELDDEMKTKSFNYYIIKAQI